MLLFQRLISVDKYPVRELLYKIFTTIIFKSHVEIKNSPQSVPISDRFESVKNNVEERNKQITCFERT